MNSAEIKDTQELDSFDHYYVFSDTASKDNGVQLCLKTFNPYFTATMSLTKEQALELGEVLIRHGNRYEQE